MDEIRKSEYRFCVSEDEKNQLQEVGLLPMGEIKPKQIEVFFQATINTICMNKGLNPIVWDIGRESDSVGVVKRQILKKLENQNLTTEQRTKLKSVYEML